MTRTTVSREYLQNRPKTKLDRVLDFLSSDKSVWLYLVSIFVFIALPFLFIPFHLVIHFIIRYHTTKRIDYPFFVPTSSGQKVDLFNPSPAKDAEGNVKYDGAAGIAYFGNVRGSNEQVYMSNSILRQHIAFLAATGSGKTFTISSIACCNALIWGAGYMYIDAKADLDLVRMHESMLWRMNKIDDLFTINYIRGSRDQFKYASDKTTNTYNILESGSAAQNNETMKSLMDGDGDIWAKRADSLLAGLLRPLTYMRDRNILNLSVLTLLDYLTIETAGSLLGREDVDDGEKKQLLGFIKTLPGMSNEFFLKITKGQAVQSPQVYDQWGFASMQIILVINTLAGDYGDIFGVTVGEIDIEAIVLQDRVLIGLLPALEGSTESVASMGRIIMAARKSMMGRGLGECVEGSVLRNLTNRATNAPYPYINVLDEAGMMFSSGEGAASAQARGLGFSLWYSAQDLPAMQKLSEQIAKEVLTVMGNTIIKIAGRIIDDETFNLFSQLADEEYVWQRESMDLDYSGYNGGQRQKETRATYQKENRLQRREVQRLREGEMFINAVDRLYQVDGPNLHPQSLKTLMLNDYLIMLPYSDHHIETIKNEWTYLEAEYELITSGKYELNKVDPPALNDIARYSEILGQASNVIYNSTAASSLAFSAYVRTCVEEMNEIASTKDSHYERLKNLAPNVATIVIPSEDDDGVPAVLQESSAPAPLRTGDTEFSVSDTELSSDKDGSLGSSGATSSASTYVDIPEIDKQESDTGLVSNAMDQYFESVGLSRDRAISQLTEIAALSERREQLHSQLNEGTTTVSEANTMLDATLTTSELAAANTSAASAVSDLYSKTAHPHDPIPTPNKELTLRILQRIKVELKKRSDSNRTGVS